MSLENRFLKYTEDITEDVYNEVIEVLEEKGKTSYDNITSFANFRHYGFLNIYTGAYICDHTTYRRKEEITAAEILTFKK